MAHTWERVKIQKKTSQQNNVTLPATAVNWLEKQLTQWYTTATKTDRDTGTLNDEKVEVTATEMEENILRIQKNDHAAHTQEAIMVMPWIKTSKS